MLEQCFIHNFACSLTNFWKRSLRASLIKSSSRRLGAATFHYQVISQILRGNESSLCFIQPTYRPFDCDFALANKLQRYHQYQVIFGDFNGSPNDVFLLSLKDLGLTDDSRLVFRKSSWRSQSLNAFGNGWECILNTVEIAQITLFKQVCGITCSKFIWEIAYGLERLAFALSGKLSKSPQTEIARSTFHKTITSFRLIQRLKSIVVKTNLIKSSDVKRLYWSLLSFTDVYNRLIVKSSIKRTVLRRVLTKIQLHVKFIANNSSKNCFF
ncbi:MAG: glycine--tRNA ligase subunit alpha [Candidatus Hodgkinia cicadicola]